MIITHCLVIMNFDLTSALALLLSQFADHQQTLPYISFTKLWPPRSNSIFLLVTLVIRQWFWVTTLLIRNLLFLYEFLISLNYSQDPDKYLKLNHPHLSDLCLSVYVQPLHYNEFLKSRYSPGKPKIFVETG